MCLDSRMFVIHAPWPYSARSAGQRALYVLAGKLQERGEDVAIWPLPQCYPEDPCPVDVPLISSVLPDAIHVVPDICAPDLTAFARTVRWLLGPRRYAPNPGDLEVAWSTPGVPRLMVDVIEPEYFYPKTELGEGIVWWRGKGLGSMVSGREITYDWPTSRKELGEVLRAAELFVSFDPMTALTLEAQICGTRVSTPNGQVHDPLFDLPYEQVRKEIAGDVDDLIEKCEAHW